jgi:hypothetical protein
MAMTTAVRPNSSETRIFNRIGNCIFFIDTSAA